MKYVHIKGPHKTDKEYVIISDLSAPEILAMWRADLAKYTAEFPEYYLPLNRWLSLNRYQFCYTTTLASMSKEEKKAKPDPDRFVRGRGEGESSRDL